MDSIDQKDSSLYSIAYSYHQYNSDGSQKNGVSQFMKAVSRETLSGAVRSQNMSHLNALYPSNSTTVIANRLTLDSHQLNNMMLNEQEIDLNDPWVKYEIESIHFEF